METVKYIVGVIVSLAVLVFGVMLYNVIARVLDNGINWKFTLVKVLIAVLMVAVYALLLFWLVNILGVNFTEYLENIV